MGLNKLIPIMALCFISICLNLGCALFNPEIEIRSSAYITEKGSGWKITSDKYSKPWTVDYLENNDITIQLHITRNQENQFFGISTYLYAENRPVEISPSLITVTLSNGEVLNPKALDCNNPKWDLENLRLYSSINEPLPITKNKKDKDFKASCFVLFFDHVPPSVEDEFVLHFNGALTSFDKSIKVPQVHFRKKVERIYRLGLIM